MIFLLKFWIFIQKIIIVTVLVGSVLFPKNGILRVGFDIDDTILFYPNISNANDFFWDFGNGEFSNDSVAFAIYNDSGSFIPTLIAINIS